MGKLFPLSIAAAALASCSYAPPPAAAPMTPKAHAQLNQLLAGKTAGSPRSCLPEWAADRMIVVDDHTIAYRDGPGRVWINKPIAPCSGLGRAGYTLVTRRVGGSLCSGQIGEIVDLTSGASLGSCVLGDFTPYARP